MSILNLVISFVGGGFGAYIGLRVAITRLEENAKAIKETLADHNERLKRLESVYFRAQ